MKELKEICQMAEKAKGKPEPQSGIIIAQVPDRRNMAVELR